MKAAERQPVGRLRLYGGVFVKEMYIPDADTLVPTHAHQYDHISYLAAGAVTVCRDGEMIGTFTAPTAIEIPARSKHAFISLVPGTLILCIHSQHEGEEAIPVHDEHHLALED